MKVFWQLLQDGRLREAVAQIMDVQGQWLRGELEPEEAVKQIVNIVLNYALPGVQQPQIEVEVLKK